MRIRSRTSMLIAAVAVVFAASRAAAGDVPAEFPWDPVALVAGTETAGKADLFVDHYVHRYRFANNDNRELFRKNPERYEIQLGGGCARMGSLSGACDIGRYAVHDGKIYVFASDACRKTFLGAPDSFMERDDVPPTGDAESMKRGRDLIDKAVEAMGGGARIDAVKSYRARLARKVPYDGRDVSEIDTTTVAFPGAARSDYAWGEKVWSSVLTPDDAWFSSAEGVRPMHAQQRAEMCRQHFGRNLLGILKSRRAAEFVALDQGAGPLPHDDSGMTVHRVAVFCDGVTSSLAIDPVTGRIHGVSFRGRGPTTAFGRLERIYREFRDVNGVMLPVSPVDYFDGKPVDRRAADEPTISLDVEIGPSEFRRPPTP